MQTKNTWGKFDEVHLQLNIGQKDYIFKKDLFTLISFF